MSAFASARVVATPSRTCRTGLSGHGGSSPPSLDSLLNSNVVPAVQRIGMSACCSLDEPGKPFFVEHPSRLPPRQIARASSGARQPPRLTTMQAAPATRTPRTLQPHAAQATAGACRRTAHSGAEGMQPWPPGTPATSEGMHRWFPAVAPDSPISVSKIVIWLWKLWWAQVGSNHRLLACKAEYGKDYAQLSGPVHTAELRKPCREVPQGAWGSLHGGSRKWFPEQHRRSGDSPA